MRKPFAYESNVPLIRSLLVPDPVESACYEEAEGAWRRACGDETLMEWLVRTGCLGESELITALEAATGQMAGQLPAEAPEVGSPEGRLLESAGFLVWDDREGEHRVAGGDALPPDLSRHIGEAAAGWRWVLLSPIRREPEGAGGNRTTRDGEGVGISPVERRLLEILDEAALREAPDIHFERAGARLGIRIRKGNKLIPLETWHGSLQEDCLTMLKRWAGFSTGETGLPQDGRIDLQRLSGNIAFRASHLGTVDGESLVLRFAGRRRGLPDLEALGVPGELAALLREIVLREHGLALISGPTCSGKTTTACSLLSALRDEPLKILTIEDPVEHLLPGAVQSSVDEGRGWTFPEALRAYLRQDPDLLFVGETRDGDSASIAARAGLTGHAVLSTIHARSPAEAIDRMAGWGIPAGVLAESLRIVVTQHLVGHGREGKLEARFDWIRPGPDQTLAYLRSGRIPEDWLSRTGSA